MIVLLLLTRDEGDLLRQNLEHHLSVGFDHIAVADNDSSDETQETIRSYGDAASTIVFRDLERRLPVLKQAFHQVEKRHGPVEWAAVSDTDEFWWSETDDLRSVLAETPHHLMGVNFSQKLFRPTELDQTEGPVYCRRIYRTSGPESPLHLSYGRGKTIYRGAWLRNHALSNPHWSNNLPHAYLQQELPLIHHYMIDDEDSFVRKARDLTRWNVEHHLRGKSRLYGVLWRAWHRVAGNASRQHRSFKREWSRLYEEEGELAVRELYRETYVLRAADVAGHLERGDLVLDTAFADFKLAELRSRPA